MSDREALKMTIIHFSEQVKRSERVWKGHKMPQRAMEDLVKCNQMLDWAERKLKELNRMEFPEEKTECHQHAYMDL